MLVSGILLYETLTSGCSKIPGTLVGLVPRDRRGMCFMLVPLEGSVGESVKFGVLFSGHFDLFCLVCLGRRDSAASALSQSYTHSLAGKHELFLLSHSRALAQGILPCLRHGVARLSSKRPPCSSCSFRPPLPFRWPFGRSLPDQRTPFLVTGPIDDGGRNRGNVRTSPVELGNDHGGRRCEGLTSFAREEKRLETTRGAPFSNARRVKSAASAVRAARWTFAALL